MSKITEKFFNVFCILFVIFTIVIALQSGGNLMSKAENNIHAVAEMIGSYLMGK